MSHTALNSDQFGGAMTSSPTPDPIRAPINEEPTHTPLPYSSKTNSSSKQAAVWRKPANISYSSSTSGSVFDPYGS